MISEAASPLCLAIPLKIRGDGQFERTDQVQAVMSILGAMASSSGKGWPHAPWFGMLPLFENAKPDIEDQPMIANALNTALARLELSDIRVAQVRSPRATDHTAKRVFEIALLLSNGVTVHRRFTP